MQSDNVIEFIETPNRAEETRTALRWLKARLVRDHCAPGEVALLARNVEPYRAFIEETAAEFGMPIYLSEGANLAENPAIAALLNLLTLPLKDFPRRAVVDAWHSPYADWSAQRIEPGDAERLDAAARWGQVIAGRAQWEDTLTRLARATRAALLAQAKSDEETAPLTAPIGPAASALWSKFQTFAARLTPPSQATLCDYTAWIEALIGDDPALLTEWQAESDVSLGVVRCARAEAATRERDVAALRAFKDVLRALVFAESALNKSRQLSFAEFLAELSGAVQAARYRVPPLDETETILVASVLTARGLSFCAVALVGLAEGEFPQPASEDPLLGEADRSALSLAPRLVGDEVTIFYEAVTRARERLLLTRPYLADDGQPWEPSPYWVHVQRLLDAPTRRVRPEDALPLEDAASAPELLTLLPLPPLPSPERPERSEGSGEGRGGWGVRGEAVRVGVQVLAAHATDEARGPHDGDLTACRAHLARAFPSTRPWSASRLETYGACPFAFFIVEVLGLEARPPAEAGFDVRQLGTMYHAILEQLLRDALDPTDLDALLARLPPICRAIFDAAPETYGFRPTALWQQQRAELERILADTLRALAEASEGWRPRYFELAYGKDDAAPLVLRGDEGSEIRLRGYIDRVDVNDAGELRVVDYKAGSTPISKDDLGEGRRLQLPLYARALRDALKIGTPVAGMYWHIGAAKASSFKLEKYPGGVDAALETAARHALAYVSRVANGDFASRAPDDGCPAWCPATAFCWRYKPKRK
jgi:ATP-dependent helicase/nuclease subunit B